MRIEGAILVGGGSRRMGADKASLLFLGETLEDRLARIMRPLVTRLRFIGHPPSGRRREREADVLPGLGPLGGIHTALATTQEDAVLVLGCDLPFVTTELLRGLTVAARENPEADAVVPWPEGAPVPVCAVYRTRCRDALRSRLERGELRASDFVRALSVHRVGPDELRRLDPEGRSLFNMNRPADYEAALEIIEREAEPAAGTKPARPRPERTRER